MPEEEKDEEARQLEEEERELKKTGEKLQKYIDDSYADLKKTGDLDEEAGKDAD